MWALYKSPVLAVFLIMFFIYLNEEHKKDMAKRPNNDVTLSVEDLRKIELEERKRAMTEEGLKDPLVLGSVSHFDFHGDFIIDNYNDRFYRVIAPNGVYLEKIFLSLDEAKKEVDIASSVMPVEKPKGRKIYDIRFVK
jgi:hypothetical protein